MTSESTKNLNSIFKIAQDPSNLTELITYGWNQICQIQELYFNSDRNLKKSQICQIKRYANTYISFGQNAFDVEIISMMRIYASAWA